MSDYTSGQYIPNAPAYEAMDAINAARDKLIAAIEDFAHCQKHIHNIGQSPEWRKHNLTNAHLLEIHEAVDTAMRLSQESHLATLKAVRKGRAALEKAFVFSHASLPRVGYEGGCDC